MADPVVETAERGQGLSQALRRRHMSMIAIGGAIGAGLFVGSGTVIHSAGPAAVLSYAIAGLLVLFTLRMLGEMVVARPSPGAFADYARDAHGRWAGFMLGWVYWYQYVIIVAAEATAGAAILHGWVPAVPGWALSLGLLIVMTIANLVSVRSFGEFEFWFASIKVAAIVVFMIVCALFALGLWPDQGLDFTNLYNHGGFTPNGITAIFSSVVVVTFSFGGTEIVAIAAGESAEPERAVARATTGVVWRVGLFYVASILLVVIVLPWSGAKILASPYVGALDEIGLPAAGTVMNIVILVAVLSVLNSALYVSSRMLRVLTVHGDAPKGLVKLNRRRVPARAILLGTVLGYLSVIAFYLSPDKVFTFLLNSAGTTAVFMWLFIATSQLRMRARLRREAPERLTFLMWGYPYLTILTIAAFVAVLVSMAFISSVRSQLFTSLLALAVIAVAYLLRARFGPRPPADTRPRA